MAELEKLIWTQARGRKLALIQQYIKENTPLATPLPPKKKKLTNMSMHEAIQYTIVEKHLEAFALKTMYNCPLGRIATEYFSQRLPSK